MSSNWRIFIIPVVILKGSNKPKKALLIFLNSLPIDCYVNIVGFGSTYHFLFPESRKYGDSILELAQEHIESLDANLGGAEMLAPLEALLAQRTIDGYQRQIFILTDGEVSNPDQVISLVRRQSGKARVFALGLGSSPSHHLVEGIARAGNGTALFASLEEGLEKKVMHQLEYALQPSLTNVKVTWDGYEPLANEEKLRQAPYDGMIPPVFDGRHFVVYALPQEGARMPQFVKLVADSPAGPLSAHVPLDNLSDSEEGLLLHRLAAKKLIQLLQDRQDDHENYKKEIIKLGSTYGLASRYTSYVAVDLKAQSDLKESWKMMKLRHVPVQDAHGWGGGFYGGEPNAVNMMKRREAPMMLSLGWNADSSQSRSSFAPAAKRMTMQSDWLANKALPVPIKLREIFKTESVLMDLVVEAAEVCDYILVRDIWNRYVPADAAQKLDGVVALYLASQNGHWEVVEWLLKEKMAELDKDEEIQIAKNIVIYFLTSTIPPDTGSTVVTDVYSVLNKFLELNLYRLDVYGEISDIGKALSGYMDEDLTVMEVYPFLDFVCFCYAIDGDRDFVEEVKSALWDNSRVNEILDCYVDEY